MSEVKHYHITKIIHSVEVELQSFPSCPKKRLPSSQNPFKRNYNNIRQYPPSSLMERFVFNGLDLSTYNNFSSSDLPNSSPKQLLQTSTDDLVPPSLIQEELLPLQGRLPLPQGNSYEISFEKGFMAEHSAVFQRELQNYMEFVGKYLTEYDRNLLRRFPEGLHSVQTGMAFEEVLMMAAGDMTEETKTEFIKEVKGRDKLQEFLNLVADSCPSEVAVELIYIAQQLLTGFLDSSLKEDQYMDRKEVLEIGEDLMDDLEGIRVLDLSILPHSGQSQQLRRKFLRFLEVYCCTVMLVIGQFFQNPYSGLLDELKRPSGDFVLEEEGGQGNGPQKKRKFSF